MPAPLFSLSTPQFELTWAAKRLRPTDREEAWQPPGQLAVRTLRRGLTQPTVNRYIPKSTGLDVAAAEGADLGPRLSEETEYFVYLRPRDAAVDLDHDDPRVTSQLRRERDETLHGSINFGSNIGFSDFRVVVDGRPAYAFTVEVFPTKLDYETDYKLLVADVQDIATSLALEYLCSTYQLGRTDASQSGDELQWVILLRHIFNDLERGLRHIAARPRRSIVRDEVLTPIHRVGRPDSSVRRSVRRQKGSGPLVDIGRGVSTRAKIWAQPAGHALDTSEHRWLAHQIRVIQQRLSRLVRALDVDEDEDASRRRTQVDQLRNLEAAAARLGRLEPLAAATEPPPPGFASQQLTSAPGYREAYQACLMLRSGLHLEGEALRLSTKELHQLYEYWCYLIIVRLLIRLLDLPQDPASLFQVQASGLRLNLRHGHGSEMVFKGHDHRVRIRYNPSFQSSPLVLVPQRPDILVTFEHDGWPALHLVIDAKYRIDHSPPYVKRYGGVGPPDDALNVLHRYRDAILEEFDDAPAHHVVQAAAMFPGRDEVGARHGDTRHWMSLERIGVGALPALPEATDYVESWLRQSLVRGGWQLSDRSIPHAAHRQMDGLRRLARERVWIVTADERSVARARHERTFGLVFHGNEEATRADWLGLLAEGTEPTVRMTLMSVRSRAVPTSGAAEHGRTLELGLGDEAGFYEFEVDAPVRSVVGTTSVLAVERADALSELALTSVEDWRLRDALHARGTPTTVETVYDDLPQRPWLRTAAEGRGRYEGRDGYAWESPAGDVSRSHDLDELLSARPGDQP